MAKIIAKDNSEYTRTYENMRGVSFNRSRDGSKNGRYAYLENMYIDYESQDLALESIPGFRRLYSFGDKINGAFLQKVGALGEYILVHSGDKLYRFKASERDTLTSLDPIGSLGDTKTRAFTLGSNIFLLDGQNVYRVSANGEFTKLGDAGFEPYVPTTFKNGEAYEDRNLLTDDFSEIYRIGNALYDVYETPGLVYEILDESDKTCALAGKRGDVSGEIHVPSYKTIGGVRYTVIGIKAMAFSGDSSVTKLITNDGLKWIDDEAFFGCTSLTEVRISSTVERIGDRAFHGADALIDVMLGRGMKEFGSAVFSAAEDMCIYYPGNQLEFEEIKNYEICNGYYKFFGMISLMITIGIRVNSPMQSLSVCKIGGVAQTKFGKSEILRYAPTYDEENGILKLVITRRAYIEEKNIEICGVLKSVPTRIDDKTPDFFASVMGGVTSARDAILGCTQATTFDGRIFLSGNPLLGGTVFYSTPTKDGVVSAAYFGSRSYFIDGLGDYPVSSVMTSSNTLAVFKSGDDGSGSIFYHTPSGTESERKYPQTYVHTGIGVTGESFNFFDLSLFICKNGVCSLDGRSSNGYKEVRSLSDNVNARLLSRDLSKISVAEWCGYLVLCSDGEIFLADSHDNYGSQNAKSYEWYYLNGIGTYSSDYRVYRYASVASDGLEIHSDTDKAVPDYKSVMSRTTDDGNTVYYTVDDGTCYAVYPTAEYVGGDFSGASLVLGYDKLLFFFTDSGDMCIFNNDMRGKLPNGTSDLENPCEIHPFYYSFAGHAPRYVLQTARDDCDVAYLTKKSVRNSLVLKLKCPTKSSIICKVGTDTGDYSEKARLPASRFSFETLDFSSMAFLTDECSVVPISEAERGWISKEITLCGEEFSSPIGVYSINYRYKIKGKIKKH